MTELIASPCNLDWVSMAGAKQQDTQNQQVVGLLKHSDAPKLGTPFHKLADVVFRAEEASTRVSTRHAESVLHDWGAVGGGEGGQQDPSRA